MLRERFKQLGGLLGGLLTALAAFAGALKIAPFQDDLPRPSRGRVPTAGEAYRRKLKAKRRRRNQIAFESRRRNWGT